MNLFKKALVATAIVSACGTVNAADLTDATTKYSAQGIEVTGATAVDSKLIVKVREQLEALDEITLQFGLGVTATGATAGTAASGSNIGILYGSGTYEFDVLTFTAATATMGPKLVLQVKTGDPVTLDSSFEISVTGTNLDISKASQATVTYSAADLNGVAKDTTGRSTGNFIVTQNQYGGSVKTKLNGVIEREEGIEFESGFSGTDKDTDTLVLTLTDNQNLSVAANDVNVQATVTLTSTVDWPAATVIYTPGKTSADDVLGTATIGTNKKELSFTVTDSATADGLAGDVSLLINNAGEVIKAADYTVSVAVDADSTSATNTPQSVLTGVDAGEWEVDATIINIPYLPIGFEGTSSIVHFSNTSDSAVDVIVSAVSLESDDSNEKYDAVDLGFDLPANSVTKIKQSVFKNLFELDDETKLSVTFNVNGDSAEVNAYATTKDDVGRTEISASDLD